MYYTSITNVLKCITKYFFGKHFETKNYILKGEIIKLLGFKRWKIEAWNGMA